MQALRLRPRRQHRAADVAQPVRNDIAGILRRTQPRCQRYRGGLRGPAGSLGRAVGSSCEASEEDAKEAAALTSFPQLKKSREQWRRSMSTISFALSRYTSWSVGQLKLPAHRPLLSPLCSRFLLSFKEDAKEAATLTTSKIPASPTAPAGRRLRRTPAAQSNPLPKLSAQTRVRRGR